jgi:hypothetical protein
MRIAVNTPIFSLMPLQALEPEADFEHSAAFPIMLSH